MSLRPGTKRGPYRKTLEKKVLENSAGGAVPDIINKPPLPMKAPEPLAPPPPPENSGPGPMPPLGGSPAPPPPLSAPGKMPLPTETAEGLGQFLISSTKSLENIVNGSLTLARVNMSVTVLEIGQEEARLWGTFALPVVEKYFPKLKDSPEYALLAVSVLILGGKFKIKSRGVVNVPTNWRESLNGEIKS